MSNIQTNTIKEWIYSKGEDYINPNEIIKYSEFIGNNIELNDDGNFTFIKQLNYAKMILKKNLHKLLINEFKENEQPSFQNYQFSIREPIYFTPAIPDMTLLFL